MYETTHNIPEHGVLDGECMLGATLLFDAYIMTVPLPFIMGAGSKIKTCPVTLIFDSRDWRDSIGMLDMQCPFLSRNPDIRSTASAIC